MPMANLGMGGLQIICELDSFGSHLGSARCSIVSKLERKALELRHAYRSNLSASH